MTCVIGIDIGTTSTIGVLLDTKLNKILLKEDLIKLGKLQYSEIKELVSYYQVSNKISDESELKKTNFNITFDKDKMHHLFHKKNISYSKISDNELFILPILKILIIS